jgi:hypothetical protein
MKALLGGVTLQDEDLPAGILGQYTYGPHVEETISIDSYVAPHFRVCVLTHELIHLVQDKWEGLSFQEISRHGCPYYGAPDLKCDGGPSMWPRSCLLAWNQLENK